MPAQNILYRSRIEISRMMQALATEHVSLSADIRNSQTFATHVLGVDERKGCFFVPFSTSKHLNGSLLKLPLLRFSASYHDAHVTFEVPTPTEAQFEGSNALCYPLPLALVYCHRRECSRIPVPAEAELRCIADEAGFIPFESHITDISHEGLGGLIYDSDVHLEPLTVLRGCRIILPGGKAVTADLEVRYVTPLVQADGTQANRAGFRFIQKPEEVADLIDYFVQDLDRKPG